MQHKARLRTISATLVLLFAVEGFFVPLPTHRADAALNPWLVRFGVRTLTILARRTVVRAMLRDPSQRQLGKNIDRVLRTINELTSITHLVEWWGGQDYEGRSATQTQNENTAHVAYCGVCRRTLSEVTACTEIETEEILDSTPPPEGTYVSREKGLMWADDVISSKITWHRAKRICESSSFARFSDWRLPALSELKTIAGTGHQGRSLWSADELMRGTGARTIGGHGAKSGKFNGARCVRDVPRASRSVIRNCP